MRRPDLHTLYHPITATPFRRGPAYTELPPPPILAPYIRCFWGTPEPFIAHAASAQGPGLVIPDTCMDIIFTLDDARQTISGVFCAMDEAAYVAAHTVPTGGALTSTFAIRFYAWSATLFVEHPLSGSKNQVYDAADFFPTLAKRLTPMLISVPTLARRAEIAAGYLLACLRETRLCPTLMNAADDIIAARGTMRIADLAAKSAVSRKRLERVFDQHMGLSPKAFSSLVRYQLLWQELCLSRGADILDLTEKYGYFDQAHLLNDFKRRHTMTPTQAVSFASGVPSHFSKTSGAEPAMLSW